jgi:hypothetical protein
MEGVRFLTCRVAGRNCSRLIVFGILAMLAGGVSSKLFAAPQETGGQGLKESAPVQPQMEHEGGVPTPLTTLIEEAKRNDPAIHAAEQAARAATFVAPQMSSLPDPQFTLQQFSVGSPRPFAGYTNSVLLT